MVKASGPNRVVAIISVFGYGLAILQIEPTRPDGDGMAGTIDFLTMRMLIEREIGWQIKIVRTRFRYGRDVVLFRPETPLRFHATV